MGVWLSFTEISIYQRLSCLLIMGVSLSYKYMAELLTYRLSLEAQQCIANSELSRRQIAKRLKTSVPQLYRLLDPTNARKSMKQLVALLHILNCDVDLVVKKRAAA